MAQARDGRCCGFSVGEVLVDSARYWEELPCIDDTF